MPSLTHLSISFMTYIKILFQSFNFHKNVHVIIINSVRSDVIHPHTSNDIRTNYEQLCQNSVKYFKNKHSMISSFSINSMNIGMEKNQRTERISSGTKLRFHTFHIPTIKSFSFFLITFQGMCEYYLFTHKLLT